MRKMLARFLALSIFGTLSWTTGSAQQAAPQDVQQGVAWPIRPVRLIVPAAAGGPTDIVGRVIAAELSQSLASRCWSTAGRVRTLDWNDRRSR